MQYLSEKFIIMKAQQHHQRAISELFQIFSLLEIILLCRLIVNCSSAFNMLLRLYSFFFHFFNFFNLTFLCVQFSSYLYKFRFPIIKCLENSKRRVFELDRKKINNYQNEVKKTKLRQNIFLFFLFNIIIESSTLWFRNCEDEQ
jgi:hypothetical protein